MSLGPIVQLGFVVPELGAAIDAWVARGVGPFFEIEKVSLRAQTYRGRESAIEMSVAIAYSGDVQIELITQRNEAESVYRDFARARPGGGLHHVAHLTEDFEGAVHALEARGHVLVQRMESAAAGRFAYFDEDPLTGHYLELLEAERALLGLFAHVKRAGTGWDGSMPRRKLG